MNPTRNKAFTLIEVLIVVIIIGILAAITLPRYSNSAQTAMQNSCDSNVKNMNSQWELKFITRNLSTYPSLSEVTGDNSYFPDGVPFCPFETPYADGDSNNRVEFHTHLNVSIEPTVSTQNASNITKKTARLNVSYNFQSYSGTVLFYYKQSSDSSWSSTSSSGTLSGSGTYFKQINQLNTNTSYDFYAELTYNSTTIQGSVLQFTTLP